MKFNETGKNNNFRSFEFLSIHAQNSKIRIYYIYFLENTLTKNVFR